MDNMPENKAETEVETETDGTVAAEKEEKEIKRIEITLEDFIKILRDNKKLYCISSLIICALIVLVFLFILKPVYDVDSSVEIRSSQTSTSISPFDMVSQFIGGGLSNSKSIDFELLKSRTLMDAVIEKNNLRMKVSKNRNSMFFYYWNKYVRGISDDTFFVFRKIPASLTDGRKGTVIANEEGYKIEYADIKAECRWNADCAFGGETVFLEKIGTFTAEAEYTFKYTTIIAARDGFLKSLNVDNGSSQSGPLNLKKGGDAELIKIVFTHESPLMSAKILGDLIASYIDKKKEWESDDSASKQAYINSMLSELSLGIDEKAQKMIVFQHQENTIMPEVEFPEILKKQETMKVQIEEFKFKRKILESTLKNIEKDSGKPITLPIEEVSVQEALKYHNALIFKRNELVQRVTEEHPLKVAAEEEIKESERALKNVIKTSIAQYDRGEKLLTELLNMITDSQGRLPENLITFANLKRDVELAERVYVTLSAKLYESSISPNIGVAPVRVVDAPSPDVRRSFPKVSLFLIITVLAALFSGFFVVFAKEFFKAARDILK